MTYIPSSTPTSAAPTATASRSRPRSSASTTSPMVIGTGPDDLILEAAEACPAVAISIVDERDGGDGLSVTVWKEPALAGSTITSTRERHSGTSRKE